MKTDLYTIQKAFPLKTDVLHVALSSKYPITFAFHKAED